MKVYASVGASRSLEAFAVGDFRLESARKKPVRAR